MVCRAWPVLLPDRPGGAVAERAGDAGRLHSRRRAEVRGHRAVVPGSRPGRHTVVTASHIGRMSKGRVSLAVGHRTRWGGARWPGVVPTVAPLPIVPRGLATLRAADVEAWVPESLATAGRMARASAGVAAWCCARARWAASVRWGGRDCVAPGCLSGLTAAEWLQVLGGDAPHGWPTTRAATGELIWPDPARAAKARHQARVRAAAAGREPPEWAAVRVPHRPPASTEEERRARLAESWRGYLSRNREKVAEAKRRRRVAR